MGFELEQFKLKWQGHGEIKRAVPGGDIVAWKGKSYRCIRDYPVAYTISGDFMVNTNNYSMDL